MKKLSIILFTLIMFAMITMGAVYAIGLDIDNFGGTTPNSSGQIISAGNVIIGTIQVVAVIIAVVILVVLAVKYIAASPGEKADVKKSAITYVVGAILLFSGTAVLEIIQGLGGQIDSGTGGAGTTQQPSGSEGDGGGSDVPPPIYA